MSWDNYKYVVELVHRYGTYWAISKIIGISFGNNHNAVGPFDVRREED